jgi:chromosome segregation ATPase
LPPQNELVTVEAPLEFEPATDVPEVAQKLTPHTQSRLSALNSFDKLYHDAQEHLQDIEAKLTEVTTSHHLTRQFFNILNADIHRANDMELANINLLAEQKKLSEQLYDVARRHQEREAVIETMQQREASLAHDRDTLRADLATARLELVEAVNTVARNDAELGDLVQKLSARTVEAERRSRENEVLREKQVNLSIDLDKALKREAEGVRKIEELSAIHANEVARHTELLASLGKSEKEVHRLQVVLETAQTKQAEMADEARIMDADRQAEVARNLAEMRGLRAEVQSLQERLDLATTEKSEATGVIARLKADLSDSQSEKAVADEKLSVLAAENESYKTSLSTVTANYSQLSLEHASEQMQLDVNRQECEDLRQEIAALNARIKELLPHERMYRVAKAKLRDAGAAMVEVTNGATEEVRRARRASSQARSVNGARR